MHSHFPFTVSQILWTLTFAAQLTLLVVLLGRDRIKRYPWFTAGIAIYALHLLVEVLLAGRMATVVYQTVSIALADLEVVIGLLVVIEIGRRAFGGASVRTRAMGAAAMVVVAGGVLAAWGPWLTWKQVAPNPAVTVLNLMLVVAAPNDTLMVLRGVCKGQIFLSLLLLQLGMLVVIFGRHFTAGWRSHTQKIAIGLSTIAISWLAVQGGWQLIAKTAQIHTRQEYERIIGLGSKLLNADKVVYVAVLVWWIVCLWFDEPGTAIAEAAEEPAPSLALEEPPPLAQ
jgi:hypothetical protein